MPSWSKLLRVIGEMIAGRRRHGRRRQGPVHRRDGLPPKGNDDGWSGVVNELKHSIGPDSRPRHVLVAREARNSKHETPNKFKAPKKQ